MKKNISTNKIHSRYLTKFWRIIIMMNISSISGRLAPSLGLIPTKPSGQNHQKNIWKDGTNALPCYYKNTLLNRLLFRRFCPLGRLT